MQGFLTDIPFLYTFLGVFAGLVVLGFLEAPLIVFTLGVAVLFAGFAAPTWLWVVFGVIAAVFNLLPLRRAIVTSPLMSLMKRAGFIPAISDTERQALEAGTVWADAELFSGKPDFKRLMSESYPQMSEEEQAFFDGPAEEACRMVDDWKVFQDRDLEPKAWQFLKDEGFFGMIIPKKYGGLEFSPIAISSIIAKLSARSMPLGITAMLPNSLGPGELIYHYGTQAQKEDWLPRLADGSETPCFALTEPCAGSDAGGIQSTAEVFEGEDGKTKLKLNWNKRYITLASRATVLGLAVKLHDPSNLLGKGFHPGITCVLVPTETPGVINDRQHDPLVVPFINCPTQGTDVVVPAENIIGEAEGAGNGWKMLMECLAAGRGIMLPAQAAAGTKMGARAVGAYSVVRKQFGMSIGKFEGIEEPMARIGGWAYILEATRRYTCGGLEGNKPAVVSAIAKYQFTEIFRKAVNDAMDICGGAGISRGPRNLLAHAYMGAPISITVEGANILTRTLMIFGQGAIRCHPWAYKEITTLGAGDVAGFDQAFWGHVSHVYRNKMRAFLLSMTRGRLASPAVSAPARRYAQKLEWSSASFAFLADLAMGLIGGNLKRKEALTGRFSDVLSWMYLGTAVIRRFEAEGCREEDLPLFKWSMDYSLAQIQEGFDGIFSNFDAPLVGGFMKTVGAGWSRLNPIGLKPSDRTGHKVAKLMQVPGEQRDRLGCGLHHSEDPEDALTRLENAFEICYQSDAVAAKIRSAVRARKLPKGKPLTLVDAAVEAGVISSEEAALVARAEEARWDAIQVDSFNAEEYLSTAERKSDSVTSGNRSDGSEVSFNSPEDSVTPAG